MALAEMERRSGGSLAVGPQDGPAKRISGYAAKFGSRSEDLGGFIEMVDPAAFDGSISGGADVRMLVDHDSSKVLGRRSARTLSLNADQEGLAVAAELPDTTYGRDLAVSMARGDVSQMSFGFICQRDRWEKMPDGNVLRTLLQVELLEVSVVTFPAYPATSASVRSIAEGLRAARKLELHQEGVEACRAAIAEGRIDTSAWAWDAESQNELLGDPPDWQRYSSSCLAIEPGANTQTKGAYAFPWGKLVAGKLTCFTHALAGDVQRAEQHGHAAVAAAASDLLAQARHEAEKKSRNRIFSFRQRLAEQG